MTNYERTIGRCKYCGDDFTRVRISKNFCKPAHRTAYHRLKKRIDNMMQTALNQIYDISELTDKHPHLKTDAIHALGRIAVYSEFRRNPLI